MEVPIWSLTAEQSVSILVEYAVRRHVCSYLMHTMHRSHVSCSVFTGRVWKRASQTRMYPNRGSDETDLSQQALVVSHRVPGEFGPVGLCLC
jgi:hypothetical protein